MRAFSVMYEYSFPCLKITQSVISDNTRVLPVDDVMRNIMAINSDLLFQFHMRIECGVLP